MDDLYSITHGRLVADYQHAVTTTAPAARFGAVLTALAGNELVMSHLDPPHGASYRESGLLLLEVAYATVEGSDYRGPRQFEFSDPRTVVALRNVALAFASRDAHTGTDLMLSDRLTDLHRIIPVRVLTTLIAAHGHHVPPRANSS